jgi:hypothetical protein
LNQAFLEVRDLVRFGFLSSVGDALERQAKVAQVVAQNVDDDVAVLNVRSVVTAAAKRHRPSAVTRFDSVHRLSPPKKKSPEFHPLIDGAPGSGFEIAGR